MLIVDGHCDSLQVAYDKKISLDNTQLMFNLKDIQDKVPYIQFLATFIHTKYVFENANNGYERGRAILDKWEEEYIIQQKQYPIIWIKQQEDINKVIAQKKVGILLSTENGAIIGDKIEHITHLYNRGVRVMGITWNNDNLLGCGAWTKQDTGLTIFGKECVKKMNELGILIDVSHTSYQTFQDIVTLNNHILATHSGVYEICNHPRNLKDNQIKKIAEKQGIIGICFYKDFLTAQTTAYLEDVIRHVQYIKKLVGIDYVGLGSDFDGLEVDTLPSEIKGIKDMNKLYLAMRQNGFTKTEIEKVMGLNYIRVLKRIQ